MKQCRFAFLWISIVSLQIKAGNEKEPLLKTGGGLTFQSTFGYNNSFDFVPFRWSLAGQFTTTLKGWSIPITGSYTNKTFSYTHPFNKISLSPHYKWVKLHAGYCSMNWSPYLLSGETFLGGGVELSPGSWKIKGFYGKFNSIRIGGGISAGYSNKGTEFILSGIQQEENKALTMQVKIPIGNSWAFTGEQALSFIHTDSPLLATKAGISTKGKRLSGSLNYSRVDPGYRTFGVPFISNDEENIQLNLQGNIKERVKYSFSFGGMKKGIYSNRVQSSFRGVQSGSVSYTAKSGFGIQLNIGNFITHSLQTVELDTKHIYQVNSTISSRLTYTVKRKAGPSNLSLFFQQNTGASTQQSMQFAFSKKRKITFQLMGNFNKVQATKTSYTSISPAFSLSGIGMGKKLKWTASGSLNQRIVDGKIGNSFTQEKMSFSYTILKKPQIQCGINMAFTQSLTLHESVITQKMQGQINISSTF